jgi:ER membrane protein complex subunit 7
VDVHEVTKAVAGSEVVPEVQVWGTFRGNEWSNKGEVLQVKEVEGKVGVWEFDVKAQGGKDYFIERAGCEFTGIFLFGSRTRLLIFGVLVSPLSLLKNPMILIAGVSMLIVFGMPYIMDNSTSLFSLFSIQANRPFF